MTEKEDILENQFNIPINEDYSKELSEMCNLSEAVEERGLERGLTQGEIKKVILLIKTNAEKNRKIEEIADFLGEDIELVKRIYKMLEDRPGITVDEIYEEVYGDLEDK